MRRLPPVTALALAFAAGVALRMLGAPLYLAPLAAALLLLPESPWTRPADRLPVVAGFVVLVAAGWAHTHGALAARGADCRWLLPAGSVEVTGFVTTLDAPGRPRVRVMEGLPGGCHATVRVVARSGAGPDPAAGAHVRIRGRWSPAAGGGGSDPLRAGVLLASSLDPAEAPGSWGTLEALRRAAARLRGRVDGALQARLGSQAPLARALVVARRDGLDPQVRDAFTRSGTAHLLAISGFHVGVVALLALALVRSAGGSRRAAAVAGATVALAYAALLGLPDAATRAALLVTLVAAGRALGRPVLSVGALSSALMVLLLADPTGLGRIGFQLSFAGAFGLAFWARPLATRLDGWLPGAPGSRARGTAQGRLAETARTALVDGVAASSAATLATLALVSWHFEAVPLLGVAATLVAGPLVAAALPGLLLTVALELAGLPGAGVPAAGAAGLLALTGELVGWLAALPGTVVPVPRPHVVAGLAGALLAWVLLRQARGLGGAVRGCVLAAGAACGILLLPWAHGALREGALEIHVLDVGQGDALAIRTPAGGWILIDTGPDPGDRLVRSLRRLGVRRVALLVLTHPDLDHIGGAAEVLEALPVDRVADPGTVRGTAPYLEVLAAARRAGVPWQMVARGDTLGLDGVELAVLWPLRTPQEGNGPVQAEDPNDRSVVLRLAWAGFSALLTGDAPLAAEAVFGPSSGPVTLLKVGHHGSTTSTGAALLEAVRPQVAVVSVGRYNRFGHPAPAVVERLEGAGIPLFRTDHQGALHIRVDEAAAWDVHTAN